MTATAVRHPAAGPGLFAPGLRGLTIGMVALVSLLAFEALAVATAMPTVARDLDGLSLYALAFGGPFASGVLAMVLAGSWCDARGPVAPTAHGVLWFVAGLLVAGTAPSMPVLAAGRIVQGFGSGMLSVALYVLVGRAYPEALLRRVFAAFAGAWVVPSLVGPAVAGLTVQYLGWRWVFLAVPVLAVPAVLLIRPALRTSSPTPAGPDRPAGTAVGPDRPVGARAGERRSVRGPGSTTAGARRRIGWAVGAATGAALLHIGGQQRGATAVVLLAVAAGALLTCVPRLLPAGFARARRGLPAVIAVRGLTAAAFAGSEVFLPLVLSRERGLPPAGAGLALAVGALSWSAGSALQGRLARPGAGPRTALPRLGLLSMVIGIGTVSLLLVGVPVPVGVLGWGLTGFGIGIVYPILSALTLTLSERADQGRNSAALQLADSIFSATVLAVAGALLAATADPGPATYLAGFGVTGAVAVAALLLAGRLRPAA
ncbi:MFS transporter [Plantactinospora siamensis]|uniref:MFS transporter n=1 Tax=Plantactinospora siamensis TaxID=555372 RepID=A0ABV6NQV4_9ACTN